MNATRNQSPFGILLIVHSPYYSYSSHRSFSLRTFGPTNKCFGVRNDSVLAGVYFVHCCCPPDEMKDRVDNSIRK